MVKQYSVTTDEVVTEATVDEEGVETPRYTPAYSPTLTGRLFNFSFYAHVCHKNSRPLDFAKGYKTKVSGAFVYCSSPELLRI